MKSSSKEILKNAIISFLFISAATAAGLFFREIQLSNFNIIILYILSVLLIARFTSGYTYSIISIFLSLMLFNLLFTEPYYTLTVNHSTYIITITIMSAIAIITGALTSSFKNAAAEAREKELESNALFQMTNHLTDAYDSSSIADITVKTVSRILSCNAAFVCCDDDGIPEKKFIQEKSDGTMIHREIEDHDAFCKCIEYLKAAFYEGQEFFDFPVYDNDSLLAVLRIPSDTASNMDSAQMRIIHAIAESAALALERIKSLKAQAEIREQAARERYRGDLLRSISHDLRTPLSGIMGTSEIIMGMTDKEDPRYDLAKGIYKDADWLHDLVENILDLTKFQSGRLPIRKVPEAVEEVIGAAITIMEKRMPERDISVSVPDALIMVPMDAGLITQVLVNLLDNAAKHTPPGSEISVSVCEDRDAQQVRFTVSDRGSGIPEDALEDIFQMFYTTCSHESSSNKGIGLGLSICRSIVEAHGGTIKAENRDGGGSSFIFTLPVGGDNNEQK